MDKYKLIQIVLKDLDELKSLTEEVAEFEQDATLIIDLALSKARLLCQEIELLHEYAAPPKIETEDSIEDSDDSEESEYEDFAISDPELEIINFEQPETIEEEEEIIDFSEEDEDEIELAEEEEDFVPEETLGFEEKAEEEVIVEDEENEEPENEEIIEQEQEIEEPIDHEENQPEEDSIDYSEEDIEVEITNEESDEDVVYNSDDDEEEELIDEESDLDEDLVDSDDEQDEVEDEEEFEDEDELQVHVNDLSHDPQSGVREIYIDDLDDDDLDNFKIAPANETSGKPVMREIPKPEEPLQEEVVNEKQIIGEKFSKERSLNDAIGESKSGESKLSNGPISSLKAAIGINDRFLFIREIFNNNNEKYNTVIDQLDKLETIQEAVDYLKVNLTLQKNDTSLKFVDLLKRRFSK